MMQICDATKLGCCFLITCLTHRLQILKNPNKIKIGFWQSPEMLRMSVGRCNFCSWRSNRLRFVINSMPG